MSNCNKVRGEKLSKYNCHKLLISEKDQSHIHNRLLSILFLSLHYVMSLMKYSSLWNSHQESNILIASKCKCVKSNLQRANIYQEFMTTDRLVE